MVNHKKYKSLDYTNSLDRIFDLSLYSSVTLNIDCTTVSCLDFLDSFHNRVESFMRLRERIKCIKLFVESFDDVNCSLENIWCDIEVIHTSSKSIGDVIISECIQSMDIGNIVITNNDYLRNRSYFTNTCFLHYSYDIFMFHHRSNNLYMKDLSNKLGKFHKPKVLEECKKFSLDKFLICSIANGITLEDAYKVWSMVTFPYYTPKSDVYMSAKGIGSLNDAEAMYYHTVAKEYKFIFTDVMNLIMDKVELDKLYSTFLKRDTFSVNTIVRVII